MNVATHHQRGSALIAALFLVVVVASLGAFAMKLGVNQRQTASLELLQLKAAAAAESGIEYWTGRVRPTFTPACATPPTTTANLAVTNYDGFRGFNAVAITCRRLDMGGGRIVYDVTSTGSFGVYGRPDFVTRTVRRQIANNNR